MIACPECGASHYPGTLFCDDCGAPVHPAARAHLAARPPAETLSAPRDSANVPALSGDAPVETFRRNVSYRESARPIVRRRVEAVVPAIEARPLRIHILHCKADVEVRATTIQIGRADPDAAFAPDLDLTTYDGLERGVSRRHATIQWAEGGYVLIDRHSSNGTWLEGVRLVAGYAYQIPPNATVRFGNLVARLTVVD